MAIEDFISGAKPAVSSVSDVLDAVGTREKLAKLSRGFGGTLIDFANVVPETRKKYNFRVTIETGNDSVDGSALEAHVKSVSRPKFNIRYREQRYLNNAKRVVQGIDFDPIKIEIYDDLTNRVSRELAKLTVNSFATNSDTELKVNEVISLGMTKASFINKITIHSGKSPMSSLIGRGTDALTTLLDGGKPSAGGLDGTSMILSNCQVLEVDFGDFDYSDDGSSLAVITLSVAYQSLAFGNSNVVDDVAAAAVGKLISAL